MDLRKLKTILELFENSNLQEIEFSEGEEKIKLKKAVPTSVAAPVLQNKNSETQESEAPVAKTEDSEAVTGYAVKSPMVGTFYRSSAPDKLPFMSIGQRVEEGQTLCIVEAMKLMNEIPSPKSGIVSEIYVDNGEPVAYGTKLLVIQ